MQRFYRSCELLYLAGLILLGSAVISWWLQNTSWLLGIDLWLFGLLTPETNQGVGAVIAKLFDHAYPIFPVTIPTFYFLLLGAPLIYQVYYRHRDLLYIVLALALTSLMVAELMQFNWEMLPRPRPFAVLETAVDPFGIRAWQHLPSFPSGHAVGTGLIAAIVGYYIPRLKRIYWIIAITVGLTRIYLGTHFPFDVLFGLLIGWGMGNVGIRLTHLLLGKSDRTL